jgi:anaerobic ribonucleoside-triphosphate reductase
MLCKVKYKIAYSDLEFFGIRLRVFLKNLRIFFKNGQKFVQVRLGKSKRAEILHEHVLLG